MTINYEQMNRHQLKIECEKRGIKYASVKVAINKGKNVEEALTEVVENRNRIQRTIDKANKVFKKDFSSIAEVSKQLSKIGARVSTGLMVATNNRIDLYEKIVGTEFEFLLVGNDSFFYKNEIYANFRDFMFCNKIIPATLFKSIMDSLDGDLDKIIEECSNDPLFRKKQKPIIDGENRGNIHKLCEELGLVEQTYRKYINKGMTHEETLAACLENKKIREIQETMFPLTINKITYKSPADIKKKIPVSKEELKEDLFNLTKDELVEKYRTYGNYYKEFKNKKDLLEHYNLDYSFFTNIVGRVRNVEQAVKIVESLLFTYKGIKMYPTKNSIPNYINCSNRDIRQLKNALADELTVDGRNYVGRQFIERHMYPTLKL